MSPEPKWADDYVPVNERIEAFYAKHPEGSIQSEIVELTPDRVTVKAYAYRFLEDERPGIGHSSMDIPGSTSFTRGSEVENAETSAWGRAIAALGFEVKRGIATKEDVRNKQPEAGERGTGQRGSRPPATTPPPVSPARSAEENAVLDEILALPGMDHAKMRLLADQVGVEKGQRANLSQLLAILMLAKQANAAAKVVHASAAATVQPPIRPPGREAAPATPTLDDVLALTGGEEIGDT